MMTEPVAYRYRMSEYEAWQYLAVKPSENFHWRYIEPLYTADQLHPRVKMTQAEFDELNAISECTSVHGAMNQVYSDNNTLMLLKKRFGGSNGQAELARLWFEYRSNNRTQQETIDIVPEMKWFVARNDTSDDHRFLSKNVINLDNELNYAALKKSAKQFDTKEEAEKWTNPLTEAVQLPVEDE